MGTNKISIAIEEAESGGPLIACMKEGYTPYIRTVDAKDIIEAAAFIPAVWQEALDEWAEVALGNKKDPVFEKATAEPVNKPLNGAHSMDADAFLRASAEEEEAKDVHPVEQAPAPPTPADRKPGYYLEDGQGPFKDIQEVFRLLKAQHPDQEFPQHNRYDRLSKKLKAKIIEVK